MTPIKTTAEQIKTAPFTPGWRYSVQGRTTQTVKHITPVRYRKRHQAIKLAPE